MTTTVTATSTNTPWRANLSDGVHQWHADEPKAVGGANQAQFEEVANKAKAGCPISKLMKAKITMEAKLEG